MIGTFFRALGSPFRVLLNPEGRQAWALVLLAGSGMAMTLYAGAALWFVRTHPAYVFSLGIAAHLSIVLALTGFAGMLIKRTVKAGDGRRTLEIVDQGSEAIDAPPNPS